MTAAVRGAATRAAVTAVTRSESAGAGSPRRRSDRPVTPAGIGAGRDGSPGEGVSVARAVRGDGIVGQAGLGAGHAVACWQRTRW